MDDGIGISCGLGKRMRMGSQSPLEERDGTDLGRYGLGMKMAWWPIAGRTPSNSTGVGCLSHKDGC